MCGIFGAVSLGSEPLDVMALRKLSQVSSRRGVDGSGAFVYSANGLEVSKSSLPSDRLFDILTNNGEVKCFLGHSRLVTNGNSENQPVVYDNTIAIHNGIICNVDNLWDSLGLERRQVIDSEFIPAFFESRRQSSNSSHIDTISSLFELVEGVINTALILAETNQFILASTTEVFTHASTIMSFISHLKDLLELSLLIALKLLNRLLIQ